MIPKNPGLFDRQWDFLTINPTWMSQEASNWLVIGL